MLLPYSVHHSPIAQIYFAGSKCNTSSHFQAIVKYLSVLVNQFFLSLNQGFISCLFLTFVLNDLVHDGSGKSLA